jgi:fatty acid desaturase
VSSREPGSASGRQRLPRNAAQLARRLAHRSDLHAALTLCCDWGLVIAAVWVSLRIPGPVIYFVSVLVISRQMNVLAELHHHALHWNLFRTRRLNDALDFLYSRPLLMSAAADRASHMDHHQAFAVANDLYFYWGEGYGLDVNRRDDRRYMVWFLLLRPFVGVLQYGALRYHIADPGWRDRSFRRAMLVFWGLVLAAFTAAGRLDIVLWYWLVPNLTFYQVFYFWDDMMGHYNCPRTGTREMRGLSFLLITGHGTTYHNIHHLYPAIPWFNMRRATKCLLDESDVDVAHGFLDGVRQMLDLQPRRLTVPGRSAEANRARDRGAAEQAVATIE